MASKKKNSLEVCGNPVTMNLNTMLYQNILASRYFKEDLFNLKTYHEVVDEIYNQVTDLEPFMPGNYNQPSSAFCLLYKLFTMKLTEKQLRGLLNHKDSPYIRAIGFLYIRYALNPKSLWHYFKDYIYDYEPIKVAWAHHSREICIGQFCRQLLQDQKYFTTILPRIPVPIAKIITEKLQENPWMSESEADKYEEEVVENEPLKEKESDVPKKNRSQSRDRRKDRDRDRPRARSRHRDRTRSRSSNRNERRRSKSHKRKSRDRHRTRRSRTRSRERVRRSRSRERSKK
ncbi:pre-mRNA-splicing factor 38B-like [Zophobas morio]|uniref:pre-mRNA-splicing factor 38B-like n=1 Tax=Zophobas morio TaxID=2755281 RepID=UPI003082C974